MALRITGSGCRPKLPWVTRTARGHQLRVNPPCGVSQLTARNNTNLPPWLPIGWPANSSASFGFNSIHAASFKRATASASFAVTSTKFARSISLEEVMTSTDGGRNHGSEGVIARSSWPRSQAARRNRPSQRAREVRGINAPQAGERKPAIPPGIEPDPNLTLFFFGGHCTPEADSRTVSARTTSRERCRSGSRSSGTAHPRRHPPRHRTLGNVRSRAQRTACPSSPPVTV